MISTAHQVVAHARRLVGFPYRHRGRGPIAYDCLGLVLAVCKSAGVVAEAFDFTDYTQNVADYELQQHLEASQYLDRLPSWKEAQPADILLQRFHVALPASHLIIISKREGPTLWGVHAARRAVMEQRIAHLERNVAAYRLKEVAHG
jgi:cell wall-associated NlpC family hydrolase